MAENRETSWNLVGKVHSSQGVRGQIFVILFPEGTPWTKQWKTLVLSETELPSAPKKEYPISHLRPHSKQGKTGFILTLEHVTDRDVAESLAKRFVWIPESYLVSKKDETIYLKEIENFMVVDRERGAVGPITGFSSNGPQDLIEVKTSGGTFDVPLVKAFIVRIDFEKKEIHMDIPMGLLEDV